MLNGRMLLVGLLAIAVMCFAACGGGDDISAPVGDAGDEGDAPNTMVAEATAAPEPTIAADDLPTATPFSARMIANPTTAPTTSSSDSVSTPVSVSTETPADTPVPATVVADTPVPAATEVPTTAPVVVATEAPVAEAPAVPTAAPVSSGVEITPSQIGAIDWEPYADEGYVFYTRSEGKQIPGVSLDGIRPAECGPEIGSSFDPAVNPTYRDDSHFIWGLG